MQIKAILAQAEKDIEQASSLEALDLLRISLLGKKGVLTELLKQLANYTPQERPLQGQILNQAKSTITTWLADKKSVLENSAYLRKIQGSKLDVTLPGIKRSQGSLHPISHTIEYIENFFSGLGFSIESGPEVETPYYNFDALNMPADHPARAMHDTFYFSDDLLLRTHTSNVQIHFMENNAPPIKMIAPGPVYRRDYDATHTPMFHQVEGLMIDKNINFSHLKGIIITFLEDFFHKDIKVRFRPSFFPFTEPSAEVDIECIYCQSRTEACKVCKQSGWLEILGCGMVHPNVLKQVNIDPSVYSGFAFGFGVERFAMLKYGVDDIRLFFENDKRLLEQFGGL